MSDTLKAAIEEIQNQIAVKEADILPPRITVNQLCKVAGIPEIYPDVALSGSASIKTAKMEWKVDHFFNRPLAGCVAEYLEKRKQIGLNGPAAIDEIYYALCKGGYKFEGTTGSEENTKRGIKISLTKNTAQFAKVKEDVFGLKKWYGSIRSARKAGGAKNEEVDETESKEPVVAEETQTKGFMQDL